MDTAVALIETYLHLNGYFTVTEYPVLQSYRGGSRAVTDLDILAVRFPGAGHEVVRAGHCGTRTEHAFATDPALGCPVGKPDMIVGEVKEGAAHFNPATLDPAVLEVALARFGCCAPEHAAEVARCLLDRGEVTAPSGHIIRMIAFGSAYEPHRERQWRTVPISHVIGFIRQYLREHWDVLHSAQLKDSALAMLALLEKSDAHEVTRAGV